MNISSWQQTPSRRIVFVRFRQFYIQRIEARETAYRSIIRDGVVLDASDNAAAYGIVAGMSEQQAKRQCPGLQIHKFNPDEYHGLYHKVWSIIAQYSPLVEPTDFHEGYVDLTGCLLGAKDYSEVLANLAMQVRFTVSLNMEWAGGCDRWIAKLACGENRWLSTDDEGMFLRKCPVSRLPFDSKLVQRLKRYQIHSVMDFLNAPPHFLRYQLRLPDTTIKYNVVRGDSKIYARYPAKEIELSVAIEGNNEEALWNGIYELLGKVESTLKANNVSVGSFKVYGRTRTEELPIVSISKRSESVTQLEQSIHEYFSTREQVEFRQLKATLRDLLPTSSNQMNLFQHGIESFTGLKQVKDNLAQRFGWGIITNAKKQASEFPQRFAKLIYGRKGQYIP